MHMNDDIDIRLKEALKKAPTADNLNSIGDLYLKKGDKDMANHYYHKAVSLLNYAQKDKMMAIYKKIITHSPGDAKAYEGLLKILLRIGMVSDELKYLSELAGLYEEKGEMEKAYFAYRRLNELNPHNMQAREFLKHWEKAHPVEDIRADNHAAESRPAALSRDIPDGLSSKDASEEATIDSTGTIKDRADVGLFSVSLEESTEPVKKEQYRASVSRSGKPRRLAVIISLLTIMVISASVAFLFMKPWKWGTTGREQAVPYEVRPEVIKEADLDNYHVALFRISEDALGGTDLGKYLLQSDLKENYFYSITLQAKEGCLPESFVVSPHEGVTFIGKGKDSAGMDKTGKIGPPTKVVYRSNICGRAHGAVFIRFFVYHNRNFTVKEIAVNGLGLDSSLRIPLSE